MRSCKVRDQLKDILLPDSETGSLFTVMLLVEPAQHIALF